ncbi:MAG: exodeoxyribonuclease VII large subunit [Candidatus Jacksonbacteria bacterium]
MDFLTQLNSSKAAVRKKALQMIVDGAAESKESNLQKTEIISAVLAKLDDPSIIVQRQAVKTLSVLGLEQAIEQLKILFKTADDQQLKNLALSAVRRIEIEAQKRKTGQIEWNLAEYVFSVSDFVDYINALLCQEIVKIKGEASGISIFRDQIVYFTLKDANSTVNCWFLKHYQYQWGVELQEGIEIIVKVKPQVSPKSGRFGLRVLEMSLSGEGSLRQALSKLKRQLESEGLFDESRKRPLPFLPRNIGLITGENSAAYSDFIKVLQARIGGINIYFAPVRVQGVGSIAEICGALRYFNNNNSVDLIVLTRGGGSLEDLQSFNSEEVARAVFSSSIPIAAAVGHEKNWSLAELAADLRASTPSNAAELIAPHHKELIRSVNTWRGLCRQYFSQFMRAKQQAVFNQVNIINNVFKQRIAYHHNLLNSLKIYFDNFTRAFVQKQEAVKALEAGLLSNFGKYCNLKKEAYESLYKLLLSYSPKHVLKRGYSVVKFGEKIVKSAQDVKTGQDITVWPYKGVIISNVKSTIRRVGGQT